MAETVKVMIPEEQVEERIKQLGEQTAKITQESRFI